MNGTRSGTGQATAQSNGRYVSPGVYLEEVLLHIDMETRRTAPWPADVAAALDERVAADARLPWEPDVSGSMGLR